MVIFKPSKILLLKKISENANFISGSVLDVGAGEHKRYEGLFKNVSCYQTLDTSKESHPDILASATQIPLPDSTIDSIICTQVIGDIVKPEEAIKEFGRILKKNGIVLLTESFMNELHGEPFDYWRFTKYGLKEMFEENGFDVIKIDQIGGFFAVIAQLNIRFLIEWLKLYKNKFLNFIFKPFLNLYGRFMLQMDKRIKNQTNTKFTLGWVVIARKK